MVAKNGKSMMKLVRLPILRPMLLKPEILWLFGNSKILKDLYGWVASLATQPYKSFKFYELFNVHVTLSCKEPIVRFKCPKTICSNYNPGQKSWDTSAKTLQIRSSPIHMHPAMQCWFEAPFTPKIIGQWLEALSTLLEEEGGGQWRTQCHMNWTTDLRKTFFINF